MIFMFASWSPISTGVFQIRETGGESPYVAITLILPAFVNFWSQSDSAFLALLAVGTPVTLASASPVYPYGGLDKLNHCPD